MDFLFILSNPECIYSAADRSCHSTSLNGENGMLGDHNGSSYIVMSVISCGDA